MQSSFYGVFKIFHTVSDGYKDIKWWAMYQVKTHLLLNAHFAAMNAASPSMHKLTIQFLSQCLVKTSVLIWIFSFQILNILQLPFHRGKVFQVL